MQVRTGAKRARNAPRGTSMPTPRAVCAEAGEAAAGQQQQQCRTAAEQCRTAAEQRANGGGEEWLSNGGWAGGFRFGLRQQDLRQQVQGSSAVI
eukprot:1155297-Pelagomonas_calceolata.AAC.3